MPNRGKQLKATSDLEKLAQALLIEMESANLASSFENSSENLTVFNERKIVQRTKQFYLSGSLPLSNRRDDTSLSANGGNVESVNSEFKLATTTQTNSKAVLSSLERGFYIPGNIAEAGLGIRPAQMLTGDQVARWGPYKIEDGKRTGGFFELTRSGLRLVLEDDGVEVDSFKQGRWNINNFTKLNILSGNVYQVVYGYYGYLPWQWEINKETDFNSFTVTPAHTYKREGATSVADPNLPIIVELDNGTTNEALELFVGGRQFSTYGLPSEDGRKVNVARNLTGVGTTYEPVFSVRSKTGDFAKIIKLFNKIVTIPSGAGKWRLIVGDAPTGGTNGWVDPPEGYNPLEVGSEFRLDDTTTPQNFETIDSGIFDGSNSSINITAEDLPDKRIFTEKIYTFEIAALSGTITSYNAMKIKELW